MEPPGTAPGSNPLITCAFMSIARANPNKAKIVAWQGVRKWVRSARCIAPLPRLAPCARPCPVLPRALGSSARPRHPVAMTRIDMTDTDLARALLDALDHHILPPTRAA